MELRFEAVEKGKRLFAVIGLDGETRLFIGTPPQCERFIEVYTEKRIKDLARRQSGKHWTAEELERRRARRA